MKNLRKSFIKEILFVLFMVVPLVAKHTFNVTGRIIDSRTGNPVAYTNITVKDTFIGTASDEMGYFHLSLPNGQHVLQFYHVVYYKNEVAINISINDSLFLEIQLVEQTEQLGLITVHAEKVSNLSKFTLNPYSAKNVPAVGEPDIVRVVSFLPGVVQTNDFKTSLNIRGGHSDQNQFLLDGIEIYNPQHLRGFFSAFNLLALQDINVYTANFPVEYGSKLSGIISLNTKAPKSKNSTIANLSLISSSFSTNYKMGNTFFAIAARRTYLDLVTSLFGDRIPYNFYDINFKVNRNISDRLNFDLIAFTNSDELKLNESQFNWGNRMYAIRFNYKSNNHHKQSLAISNSNNFHVGSGSVESSYMKNYLDEFMINYSGVVVNSKNLLKYGLIYKNNNVSYDWKADNIYNFDNIVYDEMPHVFSKKQNMNLLYVYFSNQLIYFSSLPVSFKFRYILHNFKSAYYSPGLSIDWIAQNWLSFNLGAEKNYQFIAAGKEGLEWSLASPLYQLYNPMSAYIYTFGFRFEIFTSLYLKMESYFKDFSGIINLLDDSSNYPQFERGKGSSFGIDMLLEKTKGRITFQLAYSFLNSVVNFGNVNNKPNWDIPHSLKATVGFRFGRTWRFNTAFTYRSGAMYKDATGRFFAAGYNGGNDYFKSDYNHLSEYFITDSKNTLRFDPYSRLDLALRKKYHNNFFDWTLYIQVQNITFSSNSLRVNWRKYYFGSNINEDGLISSIPILPSIGAEFVF